MATTSTRPYDTLIVRRLPNTDRVGAFLVVRDLSKEELETICTMAEELTDGEKRRIMCEIASLPILLKWAREAAESERARVDRLDDESLVPSWLPELEAAIALSSIGGARPIKTIGSGIPGYDDI